MMMSNKHVKTNTHTWSSSAVSVELKMNIKKLVDRIVSTRTNLPKRLARGSSWYLIRHLNLLHFHDRVSRMLMDDCVQYCRSQCYVVKLQKPRARVRGEYFDVESNASWLSNSRFEKKIAIKTQKLSKSNLNCLIFSLQIQNIHGEPVEEGWLRPGCLGTYCSAAGPAQPIRYQDWVRLTNQSNAVASNV